MRQKISEICKASFGVIVPLARDYCGPLSQLIYSVRSSATWLSHYTCIQYTSTGYTFFHYYRHSVLGQKLPQIQRNFKSDCL